VKYANVEDISFAIRSGQIDPATISISWSYTVWGYVVWVYIGDDATYRYWCGNSPWDSGQNIDLDRALPLEKLCRYAERTAVEMAEELGLSPDCVFEEEN